MYTADKRNLCDFCFSALQDGKTGCPCCNNKKNKVRFPTALQEGTILTGRYAVGKVLGKGGFGITYLCYDLKEEKTVAVKEYLPDSLAFRNTGDISVSLFDERNKSSFVEGSEKFYEEAKLVSRFNGNPNIISVYEFFYENNTAYFSMEYLDGIDFKNYLLSHGKKITEAEALFIMNRVTNALMVVHSTGVLHRDISPDNIFICADGEIKLIDFGAARQVVGEASKSLSIILKQGFAPLEQYQKKGNQGPWTDIYALGATLYFSLTGRVIDDAMTRLDDDTLDLEGISEPVAAIISKMLASKITDRYQSVYELKCDLDALEAEIVAPVVESAVVKNLCRKCGKEIPRDKLLCDECNKSEKKPTYETNKKGFPLLTIIIIALVAVVGIGATAGITISVTNSKRSEIVLNNIAGNIENEVSKGMANVKKDGKWGCIDKSGNVVIPFTYDELYGFSEGMANVKKDGKWGYIDKSGNVVIPFDYDYVYGFSEGLARVEKDGKCGYIDKSGNVVIPCIYDDGWFAFKEGLVKVKKDGKEGYIDKSGNVVIPFDYDYVDDFSEGLVQVKKDGKYGYIDKSGNVAIPLIYDYVNRFSDGLAKVKKDDQYYYIDKSGNVVISLISDYDETLPFKEGMAKVKKDGKWGYIDKTGNVVVSLIYDDVDDFSNGFARVRKDDKWGCIDKSGNVVVSLIYDDVDDFSNGFACVRKDDKWGCIDKSEKIVIPFDYDYVYGFSEGLAMVSKDGKYGSVDENGSVVIPFDYDYVYGFSEGLAMVRKGFEYGFVDENGSVVIPFEFDRVGDFKEGLAEVRKNGKWGYIDKRGSVVIPLIYDMAHSFSED